MEPPQADFFYCTLNALSRNWHIANLEIDFKRFLFGDGEWVVTVRGEDLFS